jgi:hypothetical protein
MNRKALSVLVLLLFVLSLTGCGAGSPSVDTVRAEIERRVPGARFERECHIRLGRLTLGVARRIVHLADPGDPDTKVLDNVHRIEVATYRVRSLPDLEHRLTTQTAFEQALKENGWTMALRERDHGSRTWIFLRADDQGALSNLYVVALDPAELTLVRLDGHLDRAMADSIAEHPKKLAEEIGGEEKGAK